ncbi:protein takeout-like [Anticarsia gemmatalis]|uniref:protein takeout-like n=1 Tax=Anticarsia gemmatalis TaxID=129554 RepID=UPI003F7768CA
MKYWNLIIAVIFLVFSESRGLSIAYQRPCRDLSPECLKNTLQSVIPIFASGSQDLGLEPLDPYKLERLNLTLSGITIHFSQGYAKGLKTCVVDFARLEDNILETQLHCNLTIRGKYRSSGSLLMFPIDGDGISTITCDNLKLHSILKFGSKEKNGRTYVEVESSVVNHAYDGRVKYDMTNLFKGNPGMSRAVLNFMNRNWRMVAEEFGTPIVDYGVKSIMKNVRRFFNVLSLDELKEL